jgi:hypothetical protein
MGASTQGGGICQASSGTTSVYNCIFWGNTSSSALNKDFFISGGGSFSVNYSDVEQTYAGTGNISQNPLFVAAIRTTTFRRPRPVSARGPQPFQAVCPARTSTATPREVGRWTWAR